MDWNWNYTLPEGHEGSCVGDTDARTFYPPVPQLLDALINSELDVPPGDDAQTSHILHNRLSARLCTHLEDTKICSGIAIR
jgi:hypothetical protein